MNKKKGLKKQLMEQTVSLSYKEIEKMKMDAIDKALERVNLIPLLVLRDKFGFGQVRLSRYIDSFLEAVDDFNHKRFTLEDIEKMLEEETNLVFKEEDKV